MADAEGGIGPVGVRAVELLDRIWERLLWYWERARSERIRRWPGRALDRLGRARSILVVCQGNIIRSPFAAYRLDQALAGRPGVCVASAGLAAVPGRPAHPLAVERGRSANLDLRRHAATRLTTASLEQADVVLVMETAHLVRMRRSFPGHRGKTFLLTCASRETPPEVRDPDGCERPVFEACFDHIERALQPLARVLRPGGAGTGQGETVSRPVTR
jgi:protein-tyrosine phosphatase